MDTQSPMPWRDPAPTPHWRELTPEEAHLCGRMKLLERKNRQATTFIILLAVAFAVLPWPRAAEIVLGVGIAVLGIVVIVSRFLFFSCLEQWITAGCRSPHSTVDNASTPAQPPAAP